MATAQSPVARTRPVLTLSPSPDAATGPCRCQLTLPLVAVIHHLTKFRMSPIFNLQSKIMDNFEKRGRAGGGRFSKQWQIVTTNRRA